MARILVVDDDVEFGTALSKILKGEGYEVSIALSAPEGLELLRKDKYDLVFADLSMPGTNGLELLKDIKDNDPKLPVVIITAFGEWDAYAEAAEKGAHLFIDKPVKKEEILKVVKNILAQVRN